MSKIHANIDLSKDEIRLHEYRPNKFVIIVNGNTLRRATEAEVGLYQYREQAKYIDTDTIAIGLAVSAISAVLATSNTAIFLRVLAAICFAFSSIGSLNLFSVFIAGKIPKTMMEIMTRGGYSGSTLLWMLKRWFFLWRASVSRTNAAQELELGYLTLFLAWLTISALLLFWVFLSLFPN